jgi:hypothetical protein
MSRFGRLQLRRGNRSRRSDSRAFPHLERRTRLTIRRRAAIDTKLNHALGLFAEAIRVAHAELDELEHDVWLSIVTTKIASENANLMWRCQRRREP